MFRLVLIALLAAPLAAQSPATPDNIRLVMPNGNGSLLVPLSGGYEFEQLALYDRGTRPALLLANKASGVNVSYLLNIDPLSDTAKKCRNAALNGVIAGALAKAKLKDKRNNERMLANGQHMAIGSYLVAENQGYKPDQTNIFGFVVAGSTCAEIHLSKVHVTDADQALLNAALDAFAFDPAYVPKSADYTALAGLAAKSHDELTAGIYKDRCCCERPRSGCGCGA